MIASQPYQRPALAIATYHIMHLLNACFCNRRTQLLDSITTLSTLTGCSRRGSSQHYDILPLISSFLPMASPFTSAALPLACPAVSSAAPFAFEALMPASSAALFFASTVGRGQYNWVRVDARGRFARVHR